MTDKEYRASPGISRSELWRLNPATGGTPEKFMYAKENPEPSVPMVYACADCGRVFEPYTDKNGNTWTAQQVYEASRRKNRDGVARCADCRKKHEQSLSAMLEDGKEG